MHINFIKKINLDFKKKIIKEFNVFNTKYKKLKFIEDKNLENYLSMMENLKNIKIKINEKDLKNINNWDYNKNFKKKIKPTKKTIIEKPLIMFCNNNQITKNMYLNAINFVFIINFKVFANNLKKNFSKNVFKIDNLLFYYKFSVKTKKSFKDIFNNIIIIDNRKLKSKTIFLKNNKCLFYINNGLVFKKLNLKKKKYKKSEKITFLCLKFFIMKYNYFKNYKNIIVYNKGLQNNSNRILNYFLKKLKNKNKINLVFLKNNLINKNNSFGFKKVKSIKRKLKKKIINN